MTEPIRPPTVADIKAEIGRTPPEPLLPIEKKLIGWSLGTGIALLVILVALSRFFPVGTQ